MITRLLKDESGQTMIEYGLLIALISIAVITVLGLIGTHLTPFFQNVDTALVNATPAPAVP